MGSALKRNTFIIFIIALVFFSFSEKVYSQVSMFGGKGLWRVLSAEPVNPTDIFVGANISTFFEQTGPEQLAKYYAVNLHATVGLAHYLELIANFVPYQDDQYHILGRIGDTKLGLKYLTPLSTDGFKLGLMGYYKFPTAEVPNVPYEIFSSSKPAWELRALLSLDFIKLFPNFPLMWNFNVGYIDHSIYDRYFQADIDQLFIGSGFKFSIRSLQFYTEYSGEIFTNNSDLVPFNQNSMRITPGVKFLGPWKNTIDIAFDFAFTDYDSLKNQDVFHKEYFTWKVAVGVTHRFSVFKYFDKTSKLERQKQKEELEKLEEIRKRREKANEDLKNMKNILDKKQEEKK